MGIVARVSVPSAIAAGRRALEGLQGVSILHDWEWFEGSKRWALHLQIKVAVPEQAPISGTTEWYAVVEPEYPLGSVKFFPSKVNGFTQTFQHQRYNGTGASDTRWRSGDICLNTQIRKYDRYEHEPFEAESRLQWHSCRAVDWLADAANGQLANDGEPFEVPEFPEIGRNVLVAYAEGTGSLGVWHSTRETAGVVELLHSQAPKNLLLVKRFLSLDGRELLTYKWGKHLEQENGAERRKRGVWILMPSVPVLLPWQAPATWCELREACSRVGLQVDSILRRCLARMRDGNVHICLVGFPIPQRIGGPSANIFWQPLVLPALTNGRLPGFRDSEASHWRYERSMTFSDGKKISWVDSENWDTAQISTRGRFGESITWKSILLIGAGAIGSVFAELLVRGGVEKLLILDLDDVKAGNLTRHMLTIDDIGSPKALRLADRLNKVSPHATVVGFKEEFPPAGGACKDAVDQCDVIIDCTGSDEVIRSLEAYEWKSEKAFLSMAMGFDARRLFCFCTKGQFSGQQFFEHIGPWLKIERTENAHRDLPREGIGCWNPVFPARADDVWMLVSCAVSTIEDLERLDKSAPIFCVFERILSEGRSIGVKKRTTLEAGPQ